MYYEFYTLLSDVIYGIDGAMNAYQEETLVFLATIGCLLMVALPFLVVWRIIKLFV